MVKAFEMFQGNQLELTIEWHAVGRGRWLSIQHQYLVQVLLDSEAFQHGRGY